MLKKSLILSLVSVIISGCTMQHDLTEIAGNKRYTPSYPVSDEMKPNASGELYGEFSRYSSKELGISFEYISDASVFSSGDSETYITRSGETLWMSDQFGSRLFMIVFSGKNIAISHQSIEKYFELDKYPACKVANAEKMMTRRGREINNDHIYYTLSFSGTDLPQDGKSFCPYQERSSIAPLIIINTLHPDKIAMTFICEGCAPDPDISWINSLLIGP